MSRFFPLFASIALAFFRPTDSLALDLSACKNRILEMLHLPAEGRADVASLVAFDRELAYRIAAMGTSQENEFHITAKRLNFHLFPTPTKQLPQDPNEALIVGFDTEYHYLQVQPVRPNLEFPRPHFMITRLPGPRYTGYTSTDLIYIPNLLPRTLEIENYLKEHWDGMPGPLVMGHMLRHEWIHAQQHGRTSWGLYMRARDLNRVYFQFHPEWYQRLFLGPIVRQIVLTFGDTALYAGAKLLNEFQAQSLMPSPGLKADEIRREWLNILAELQREATDWKAVESTLSRFQTRLGDSESRAKRYQFILSSSALRAALQWLKITKAYPDSSRKQKIERARVQKAQEAENSRPPARAKPAKASPPSDMESGFKD